MTVLGVFCADLHLTLKAPVARSAEKDWLATQEGYLNQLKAQAKKHHCPIICAGDITDKWNTSPELINWLIDVLPHMFAIPGNHDLPLHNYADLKRSAFWTLVQAGKITMLKPGPHPNPINGFLAYGFPWNHPMTVPPPQDGRKQKLLDIAIVHSYIWTEDYKHPMAVPDQALRSWLKGPLEKYDAAFFGDNHKGFLHDNSGNHWPSVLNCGTFMRRTIAERNYEPSIGLLHDDGRITRKYLDVSDDKFIDADEAIERIEKTLDMQGFIQELDKLNQTGLDFVTATKRWLQSNPELSKRVRRLVLSILEESDEDKG